MIIFATVEIECPSLPHGGTQTQEEDSGKVPSCKRFWFVDDELPSQYYKDMVYDMHLQIKKSNKVVEATEVFEKSKLESSLLKEDLTKANSKLKVYERLFFVLIGLVVVLCITLGSVM